MAQQQVRERRWCTIPHTSLSSTCVVKGVKSVDDLTSADLWHYQPVCDLRLYKFDIVVVGHLDTWNSSGNSFQRSSRFQVPNEAQSCSSTNSVSHSKIKPLCKLIFCFHYVERHLHINGKWAFLRLLLLHLGIEKCMCSLMRNMYLYCFLPG